MKSKLFEKLIWAVDALQEPADHRNAQALLNALIIPTEAEVRPAFVLSPPFSSVTHGPPPILEQGFHELAEKRLRELTLSGSRKLLPGKILINRTGTIRGNVQCLIDYAVSEKADAIVVATHARKGMSRLFFGSFAETLAVHSPLPIITVNPETKVRERISKILFPTTFQTVFRRGFEHTVELCKIMEAKLTLFYKEPLLPVPGLDAAQVQNYIEREAVARERVALEWQFWANQYGVPTNIHLDNVPGYVESAIEDYATAKDIDMIAMASQAESASALIMGSTARQMIRRSPCPVWTVKA